MTIRRPAPDAEAMNRPKEVRFTPGTLLAGRYRIVSPLGRGGMGEVFRAEDLKLGQPVALKFLPEKYTRDEDWLKRLHDEVRIARGIAHPNVCRIYDIGEAEGEHFITMEYVDGEDLSSLLTRIDRLPHDKAVKFARQLCAGLAAAHDRGVLHRDLKPSNIMIDGRGNARITDFGIAALVDELGEAGQRAGTPAYMAPEQLSGGRVSVRSDVFSLGLVLYELFTGKPVYDALTVPEIRAQHETKSTTSMSSLLPDLDPAVERVIGRCLDTDERRRPDSALEVAAALPGGDPLAMALAAGETPSPEMVAAAGQEGLLSPKWALALLAIVIVSLGSSMLAVFGEQTDKPTRTGRVVLDLPLKPAVLEQRCREYFEQLGYPDLAYDSVYGFTYDLDYHRHLLERDDGPGRWDPLLDDRPSIARFWYRRANYVIRTVHTDIRIRGVSESNPPESQPGIMGMGLDPQGRLQWLRVQAAPPLHDAEATTTGGGTNWDVVFDLTDLDAGRFEPVEPAFLPLLVFDARRSWVGSFSDEPDAQVRVDAASYRGRIVAIRTVYPGHGHGDAALSSAGMVLASEEPETLIATFITTFALVVGLVLAYRNHRMGRGDRRGALRIALITFVMYVLHWLFAASRLPAVVDGIGADVRVTLAASLYFAGIMGVMYLALEPYVRRWWPESIIGWSRLLSGRWRDPIAGRDILIGMAMLSGSFLVIGPLTAYGGHWLGIPDGAIIPRVESLVGLRATVGLACLQIINGVYLAMVYLMLILIISVLTRRRWIGYLITWILFVLIAQTVNYGEFVWWYLISMGLFHAVFLLALVRYGLLVAAVIWAMLFMSIAMPIAPQIGDWNSTPFLFSIALWLAVALFGFWTALAGRPIFGDDLGAPPMTASDRR